MPEVVTYPPTRALARASKAVLYLTGKICPHGHQAPRYTSNGACSACLTITVQAGERGELPPRTCRNCGTLITKRVCPKCRKKVARTWAGKNRKRISDHQHSLVWACKRFVREYKETHPCTDCTKMFPWYVMEFDHVHGRTQKGDVTIARVVCTGSIERVKREMAKCQLVCSNCHKVRTHERALAAGKRKLHA